MSEDLDARLAAVVLASPRLMAVLTGARALALPQWRIVSGAIYQSVWNALTGRHADYGIKDYDLFYFDAADLSYAAEDRVIRQAAATFAPALAPLVEVRNQARVHLWFEARFGEPYAPLASADAAIERFVSPAFAVGVRLTAAGTLDIVAPFGLEDVFALRLRPNPNRPPGAGWARAAASARARWPELTLAAGP